jgi:hypothetical protein
MGYRDDNQVIWWGRPVPAHQSSVLNTTQLQKGAQLLSVTDSIILIYPNYLTQW